VERGRHRIKCAPARSEPRGSAGSSAGLPQATRRARASGSCAGRFASALNLDAAPVRADLDLAGSSRRRDPRRRGDRRRQQACGRLHGEGAGARGAEADGRGARGRAGRRLTPDTTAPRILYASFLRRLDDREAAEAVPGGDAARSSPETYIALAGFYADGGQRDAEAEAAYKKALEASNEEALVGAYSVLASFYYMRDRFPEAAALLEKGIAASNNNVDIIYLLARMYREKGDQAKADLLAQKATEVKPDDYHTHLVLSAYRDQVVDLDGAIEAARNGQKVAPKETNDAELRVAEVLLEIGRAQGARP
jgi:tetratricopeptide (TPR) repeat protein